MNVAIASSRRVEHRFTLTELLFVVGIIALLLGLLFPAVQGARHRAKCSKAKVHARALADALRNYYTTYGQLPSWTTNLWANDPTEGASSATYYNKYDTLVQTLTRINQTGNTGAASRFRCSGTCLVCSICMAYNPKGMVFLDAQENFHSNGYLDPWGRRFVVLMDVLAGTDPAYNNRIVLPESISVGGKNYAAGLAVAESILVYSYGRDGSPGGKDDIISWE